MDFKLEICVDTLQSAMNAQDAGADRVELCSNLPEGGTTPGYGTIASARNNLNIALNIMIRPRGGDFLYTDQEFDIMRRDIEICGECGVDGIVLGILRADGNIDLERTAKLIELADPMQVTFHRAFDMCLDPFRGLEDIMLSGSKRVLTSGLREKAEDGADMIKQLIGQAAGRIIVMPGSGINDKNIARLVQATGAKEFHLTGRKVIESEMIFRRQGISMNGIPAIPEFSRKVADSDMIISIINILKLI